MVSVSLYFWLLHSVMPCLVPENTGCVPSWLLSQHWTKRSNETCHTNPPGHILKPLWSSEQLLGISPYLPSLLLSLWGKLQSGKGGECGWQRIVSTSHEAVGKSLLGQASWVIRPGSWKCRRAVKIKRGIKGKRKRGRTKCLVDNDAWMRNCVWIWKLSGRNKEEKTTFAHFLTVEREFWRDWRWCHWREVSWALVK